MALLLVILGLIFWLALHWVVIGIVLIVIGLILFLTWSGAYGYGHWRGRGGPPA